jgi:hypothetical protein
MKYLKSVVGATTTLGALGLSMPAKADVYVSNFPVLEVHGEKGKNSSSSLAGASIMAEKGMSGTYEGLVPSTQQALPRSVFPASEYAWEAPLTNGCAQKTLALGPTLWPARCNPIGMANNLNALDPTADWVVFQENVTTTVGRADLLNHLASSLFLFGSPAVTPILGQADHFVTVFQVTATPDLASPGSFTVSQALVFDGGGLGNDPTVPGVDSRGNKYLGGLQTFTGSAFANNVFQVVTAINPNCDSLPGGGCTSDPFFNNFVLLFDPPRGAAVPRVHTNWARAAGIAARGSMTAEKAQHRVWDALIAAGIDQEPRSWDPLAGAVPGQAVLVNGVLPDGSAWRYYLVPLLTDASSVAAFVQLSADDGSFEHISVFTSPLPYAAPVTHAKAKQLAGGALDAGDRLTTDGVLTWNPLSDSELARSPNTPYYEFGVIDANGKSNTARVTIHDGTAIRGRVHEGKIVHGK